MSTCTHDHATPYLGIGDEERIVCNSCGEDWAEVSENVNNCGQSEEPTHRLIIRRASDVVCRAVVWLWQNIFVAGGINFIVGMPDVGKSVLTAYIAAKVSKGGEWPPVRGSCAQCEAGSVAFLSMEDHVEATIVPRLKEAGANLEKIAIIEGVKRISADSSGEVAIRDAFDISQDVPRLEKLRQEMPDLRLVIIDPLDSYLNAKVDTNIGNKVRAALWPLKDWAESTGVTIIIVHHFNKSVSTNAMDRVSGARSFGALPRSVWAIGREEHDDRTIMAPMKLNIVSEDQKRSLAYRLKSSFNNPSVPVIHWCEGDIDVTASELLGAKRKKTDSAAHWLRDMLSDGPIESKRLQELAEDSGQAWSTLKKAKDGAGVVVEQIREQGKVAGWHWRLEDHEPTG
ncbi:MAG: AAA family ATPase [Phycisphaeraceae bacterium]